jgi:hypothetical protein
VYLSDLRAALLRRWYLLVIGGLVTGGLCLAAAQRFPVVYAASASVVLLPPASAVGDTGNPYLALGGLDTAAGVVAHALSDSATTRHLADRGVDEPFTVQPDIAVGGPVLLVTAEGRTPRQALRSLSLVLREVPDVLVRLQTSVGTPEKSMITQEVITRDTAPSPVRKQTIRAVILALAIGVAGTVMLAALVDGLFARLRRMSRPDEGGDHMGSGAASMWPLPLSRLPSSEKKRGAAQDDQRGAS